jgi:hypothetical protein
MSGMWKDVFVSRGLARVAGLQSLDSVDTNSIISPKAKENQL